MAMEATEAMHIILILVEAVYIVELNDSINRLLTLQDYFYTR